MGRIVEPVTELTTNHDEIKGRVVACAAANHQVVKKNLKLVTILEQKYGWMWRLALEANEFVALSESEASVQLLTKGRAPAQNGDTQPHEVAAEHELELCKARESEVEARHKLEEATQLAGDLRKQLLEARKCIAELDQNRDIAGTATKLLQEENLKLKAELADTKSKLADIQKRAATEENTESLKARIESLKVSLANAGCKRIPGL